MKRFITSTILLCIFWGLPSASQDVYPQISHLQQGGLRKKRNKQNHRNTRNDDPCSRSNPPRGKAGAVGVLYVVSGSVEFAKKAFLPLMDYLRFTLNIPDASERFPNEPKWAIATEPHLCRGVLKDVISFFNVIMTDFDLLIPNPNMNIPNINNPNANSIVAEQRNRRLTLGYWKGFITERDRNHKRFVKGFKVSAMNAAPFEKTIYLDTDSVPCVADFQHQLVEALGTADIALTPERLEGYHFPNTDPRHWEVNGDKNQHNSACVIMNMKSKNTIDLLETWKHNFYNNRWSRDQPSLGITLKSMWYRNSLDHVDLDPSLFARALVIREKMSCDADSGNYLIAHKVN